MEKTIWVNGAEFILVPASTLSLTDDFMRHRPNNFSERRFKEHLTKVINSGISDFYRPKLDPSFDRQGKICYQAGLKPALGKPYRWWKNNAKEFCPEKSSRLGTKSEYVAFLGVLLKKLVASGWNITDAWIAVCDDSISLGHYWNSKEEWHDIEPTGSREVCGYFDLANTCKMLAEDEEAESFGLAGGECHSKSYHRPLALIHRCVFCDFEYSDSVGWVILEK